MKTKNYLLILLSGIILLFLANHILNRKMQINPKIDTKSYYDGYCHAQIKVSEILSKCNNLTGKDSMVILTEMDIARVKDSLILFGKNYK